jgi:hypothetical protein
VSPLPPRNWLIVNAKFLNKLGFLNDHTEQGRVFLGMIPVFSSNGLVDWTETSVPSTRQFTLLPRRIQITCSNNSGCNHFNNDWWSTESTKPSLSPSSIAKLKSHNTIGSVSCRKCPKLSGNQFATFLKK